MPGTEHRPLPTAPVTPRHVGLAALAFGALLVGGTAGFALLGESPFHAAYRTVNTVTTAGMVSEPHGTAARLLTIVLLVAGVAGFLYTVGMVIELVVGGVASGLWQRRRMKSAIDRLSGHHVLCGYGRVGTRVAAELATAGASFVVVDVNADALRRAEEDSVPAVRGDGADDAVLLEAGIDRAASLVACADDDAANTYVVLTAKGMCPDLHVVARASSESAARKLERAGADHVISPYSGAGEQIARILTRPQVTAYLTAAASRDQIGFSLEELTVLPGCPSAGRTIRSLEVRERTGALILAVQKRGAEFDGRPSPDVVLEVGDVVIGVGAPDEIAALERLLAPSGTGGA